jgi:4'-phosphopantetheinyl transferase
MTFSLHADEVHVWSVALAASQRRLVGLHHFLADDERLRAGRFVHVPSREQFVVARATLRLLLGRYLGRAPESIRLAATPTGKPRLNGGELHFNVSHTHGLALVALTRRGEVGVDVEQVRSCPTHLDLAARFFTPRESAALRALPPGRSEEAFFHVWTRKEAFLKATGLGLTHGLERFEVAVPPDDPARLLHIDGDRAAADTWSLFALEPAPGYVGTLASQGPPPRLRLHAWKDEGS